MSGNQGGLWLDHNLHARGGRGVTIDGAELTLPAMQQAYTLTKYFLASDEQRNPRLHPLGFEQAPHSAEMIEMAVTQHHRINTARVDSQNGAVVQQRLRRVAKVHQNTASLAFPFRNGEQGQTVFRHEVSARQNLIGWPIDVAFDDQSRLDDALAGSSRGRVDDHVQRQRVDHRDLEGAGRQYRPQSGEQERASGAGQDATPRDVDTVFRG